MGGPGSGRQRTWWRVSDCRVLTISELRGGGRRESQPGGEITWRRNGVAQGRLGYTITNEHLPDGDFCVLTIRYQKTMTTPQYCVRIALDPVKRDLAYCPFCAGPGRKLYVLPNAELFKCRRCQGLGYHRRRPAGPEPLVPPRIKAALGSVLEGFRDKPTRADRRVKAKRALLASLMAEGDYLRPQERRIYCLRLAKAGYSCRVIARLVGTSKSSVQRYLAAGADAVDIRVLVSERLERYRETHPLSLRELRDRGRPDRAPEPEPEEMVLVFDDQRETDGSEPQP